MLPAGVVFTGAGSQLDGVIEAAKRKLRLPAAMGQSKNINVVIDKVKTPEFLPALGLVIWGAHEYPSQGNGNFQKNFGDIFGKVRNVFQKIIPR